jgi:hypothetical protein
LTGSLLGTATGGDDTEANGCGAGGSTLAWEGCLTGSLRGAATGGDETGGDETGGADATGAGGSTRWALVCIAGVSFDSTGGFPSRLPAGGIKERVDAIRSFFTSNGR